MGNSASYETQVQTYMSDLNTQHTDLDLSMKRIEAEADRIIGIILMRQYNDREGLCKQLAYHKVDELSQFFPIETLDGVRYRLGITSVPQNATLERNRQNVCRDIVNFYLKKINLITNIQKEVPNCLNMEQEIYRNLTAKLESNRLNNQDTLAVYKKLEEFNKDIKKRYDLIEREIERIRLAKNMTELDAIARTTNTILSDTNRICKVHENELFQYSDKAGQFQYSARAGQFQPSTNPFSALASNAIPPDVNMSPPIVQRTVVQPISPVVQRTVVSPAPVVQRTILSPPPPVVQRTVVQPILSPPSMTREVRNVIQEYPVHERIVRKPVVVSQEFIEEKPPVVPAPVVVPTPVPVPVKVEEPKIPVMQFPEQPAVVSKTTSTTVVPKKQITVRADSIRRVGDKIRVVNPSKIEITRTVPKERVEVTKSVEPRVVRVEKTVIPRATTTVVAAAPELPQGVPVKATKGYVGQTPNELSVRAGEPLTYLGSSAQNWSKVKNHTGTVGWVPHNVLSQ